MQNASKLSGAHNCENFLGARALARAKQQNILQVRWKNAKNDDFAHFHEHVARAEMRAPKWF